MVPAEVVVVAAVLVVDADEGELEDPHAATTSVQAAARNSRATSEAAVRAVLVRAVPWPGFAFFDTVSLPGLWSVVTLRFPLAERRQGRRR